MAVPAGWLEELANEADKIELADQLNVRIEETEKAKDAIKLVLREKYKKRIDTERKKLEIGL